MSKRIVFMFCLITLVWVASTAQAQQIAPVNCLTPIFEDTDGDGQPDIMRAGCDLTGGTAYTDLITVEDRDGDMVEIDDWRAADIEDDRWRIDMGADGQDDLILDFQREAGTLVAQIYDRRSLAMENPQPVVRVVAPDGRWYHPDGVVNYTLNFEIDGPVFSVFAPGDFQARYVLDGTPDVVIRTIDSDQDGRPEIDWRLAEIPPGLPQNPPPMQRTFLTVNVPDDQPPLAIGFPWPFLMFGEGGFLTVSPFSQTRPPIQVNLNRGEIVTLGEIVTSRGNDDQWFVYAYNPLIPGEEPAAIANFEAPFAWYDLAADNDQAPELSIRHLYHPPGDRAFLRGTLGRGLSIIRYSWDQDNNGYWDYKLGLMDSYEIDSTVTIEPLDLSMTMIPYDDLPRWALDRDWATATFIAAEGQRVLGEGIYEWDMSTYQRESYFAGVVDEPLPLTEDGVYDLANMRFEREDDADVRPIEVGLRGEYRFDSTLPPLVYISGIDGRLHLSGAQFGLWSLAPEQGTLGSEIHYHDLNDDGYFDRWQVWQGDQILETFYHAEGYVIYAGQLFVMIARSDAEAAALETLPPRNHAEWLTLRDDLAAAALPLAPDDLRGLAETIGQPLWSLTGAQIDNFRHSAGGFRAELTLLDGFEAEAVARAAEPQELPALSPGRYVLTASDDGLLEWTSAAPPQITMESLRAEAPLIAAVPVRLRGVIRNEGVLDADETLVRITATQGDASIDVDTLTLDLPAGEITDLAVIWSPPTDGAWTLTVEAEGNEMSTVRAQTWFEVQPGMDRQQGELVTLNGDQPLGGAAIFVLIGSISLAAVSMFGLLVREANRD
jgi:hypothetical protein